MVVFSERDEDDTTLQLHHKLTIYLRAQSAEAIPPLGTVLGNLGVNSIKFCKEFNEFTQDLPSYIVLGVSITVMENRSYSFEVTSGPSIGHLVGLLRYEARLLERNQPVLRRCISLRSVVQLARYRFPQLPLQMSLPTVVAAMNASSLTIIYENYKS